MRYGKLRIAWSVTWGIVAVLLCVLWARSYWWRDEVEGKLSRNSLILIKSSEGRFACFTGLPPRQWAFESIPLEPYTPEPDEPPRPPRRWSYYWRWVVIQSGPASIIVLPQWHVAAVLALLSGLPWVDKLKWRFSLRTLLIATTLVAVVLGLIVWLSRSS